MTRLTDHRRFARDTATAVVAASALLAGLLLLTHRPQSAAGVAVGGAVGLFDILLMVRGLDRLRRMLGSGLPSSAVSVSVFTRFLLVGVLVGVMMCFRGLDPIGVVAGFLLFPVSIGLVGGMALRRDLRAQARSGRLPGAAG